MFLNGKIENFYPNNFTARPSHVTHVSKKQNKKLNSSLACHVERMVVEKMINIIFLQRRETSIV